MLPELSLLHRGTSASTEPARIGQTLPSLDKERMAGSDAQSLIRAPRWSLLALERDVALRAGQGETAHVGLARRVAVPTALGTATVVGLVALAGLLATVGLVTAITVTLAVVVRLRVTRRWCERQRLAQLDHDAIRLKAQLVTKLRRERRDELECLAMLVENVREHETHQG